MKNHGEEFLGGDSLSDARSSHEKKCKQLGLFSLLNKTETESSIGSTKVFNTYGYGVTGYFHLILSLIKVFGVMSLIITPTIVIYSRADAYVGKVQNDLEYLVRPSLGNIGHLEPVC